MWAILAVLAGAYSWSLIKAHRGSVILDKTLEIQLPGSARIRSPWPRNGRGNIQVHLRNRAGFYIGSIRVKQGDNIVATLPLESVTKAKNLSRLTIHRRLRWSSSVAAFSFDCKRDDVQEIEIELDLQMGIVDDKLKKWHRFELPERPRIVVREL